MWVCWATAVAGTQPKACCAVVCVVQCVSAFKVRAQWRLSSFTGVTVSKATSAIAGLCVVPAAGEAGSSGDGGVLLAQGCFNNGDVTVLHSSTLTPLKAQTLPRGSEQTGTTCVVPGPPNTVLAGGKDGNVRCG